jgi:ABC-2 type transport system ATP-binding protein
MGEPFLRLENVSKTYGDLVAVRDLNLEVPAGELLGLLGPNGAGKSTAIRMMTTLTAPTGGTITLGDWDVAKFPQQVKRLFGVVLQQTSVDVDLTVWENLELHGRMHRIPQPERAAAIARWLAYVELTERRDSLVKTLSGGMKRRLQIARALLHQPQMLFLDEPTVGLDPQTRRRLWEIIKDLKAKGLTVLLTTHYMEEAEFLCDRVCIMDAGTIIEVGTPAALREKYGQAVLVHQQASGITYRFFPDGAAASAYLAAQSDPTGLMVRPTTLEDIFVELTGRGLD